MNVRHTTFLLLLVVSLGFASVAVGQSFNISTVVGSIPAVPNNVPAVNATTGMPSAVLPDGKGNFYYTAINCIFKVNSSGVLTRFAGTGTGGYSGDGGPALLAKLSSPNGLAFDSTGNLYVADAGNYRIRMISPAGTISTILGNGLAGGSGDGGPAAQATVYLIRGLTIDSSGNIYFSDYGNHVVRKINTQGVVSTIAGTAGTAGYFGDSGQAKVAQLNRPEGVAVDASGNLYIGDSGNNVVRMVTPAGVISTFAGVTTNESTTAPTTTTNPSGTVTTNSVGIPAAAGFNGDGAAATSAVMNAPESILVDAKGNVYISDFGNGCIRIVTTDGNINTFAGECTDIGFSGDGAAATAAELNGVVDMHFDTSGNLYVADWASLRVRVINSSGNIGTVAGGGLPPSPRGDGGPATSALLGFPFAMATDNAGNLYFSDYATYTVRRVSASGIITTVVGNGTPGYSGDGGPALNAQIYPAGLTLDNAGNLYIADYGNNVVRMVNTKGIISTIAGNRNNGGGYSGDLGPATAAQLSYPTALAFDGSNNLYIADAGNFVVRMVNPAGNISTFAGTNVAGFAGDNGLANAAKINYVFGLLVANGGLYISDYGNYAVRFVSFSTGLITTVVGNNNQGYTGDGPLVGGSATSTTAYYQSGGQVIQPTQLGGPYGILLDPSGQLYIADSVSARILKITNSSTPSVSTIAGNGTFGYTGDGGPATLAEISYPLGMVMDSSGNIFFSDSQNGVIRKLTLLKPSGEPTAVVNAASYKGNTVAPGELVTLFGAGLGPAAAVAGAPNGSMWPTQAGNTQVLFNGALAPVIYSSNNQVSVAVPYSLMGSAKATVEVLRNGQPVSVFETAVADTAPGIFTRDQSGQGQAAALNQDTTANSAANPAHRGSVIVLYVTGEGQTLPFGVNGKIAALGGALPHPLQAVSVTIGGATAQVQYAGAAPGNLAGLMQINALIPDGITTGASVPVVVTIGAASSATGVTIAVSPN